MKRLRVYVDTSVLGGCFDPEFATWSQSLIEDFRRGYFVPVLSLARAYQAHGVLGSRFWSDMLHIATATVAQADVLVSWIGFGCSTR